MAAQCKSPPALRAPAPPAQPQPRADTDAACPCAADTADTADDNKGEAQTVEVDTADGSPEAAAGGIRKRRGVAASGAAAQFEEHPVVGIAGMAPGRGEAGRAWASGDRGPCGAEEAERRVPVACGDRLGRKCHSEALLKS